MDRHKKYIRPEVYFHVGLGKVASKYLQHSVFPRFRGLRYIPTTRFRRCIPEIRKGRHPSYLVSREFDNQFGQEVRRFAAEFPDAHPIMLLRRHDDWIASQYRRAAKNGFTGQFREFIDLERNEGRFNRESLDFYGKIELLEKLYSNRPLVLIYDDLLRDPRAFLDRIADYCHATYDSNDMPLRVRHASYSEKQIRFMQLVSRVMPATDPAFSTTGIVKFFQRIPVLLYRYSVLYLALLLPGRWLSKGPLIEPSELAKIREATRDDWERCLEYARNIPV